MVNLEAMVCCYLLHKRWVLTLVFGLLLVNFLTGIFKQEERESVKHKNTYRDPVAKYCYN
ncbi:SREBP regulating gene protein-like isoform X2 [Tamandua tetradactyla]|uniref:SREBP regulating gene protein-like isoform X2 n=1 Tax=Tamandua tetradactyla TaxID=48850 RepID=UPI0040545C01